MKKQIQTLKILCYCSCYATTRMVPRNKTHDDGALHPRFIFNLHTRTSLIFTQCTINWYLHNIQATVIEPLQKIIKHSDLLGGQVSCSWWQIPSHSGPLSGINCLPFDSCPFHPFPTPSAHITLFTMTTSTITVFFVRDSPFKLL
jgi:hypothetical protein